MLHFHRSGIKGQQGRVRTFSVTTTITGKLFVRQIADRHLPKECQGSTQVKGQ